MGASAEAAQFLESDLPANLKKQVDQKKGPPLPSGPHHGGGRQHHGGQRNGRHVAAGAGGQEGGRDDDYQLARGNSGDTQRGERQQEERPGQPQRRCKADEEDLHRGAEPPPRVERRPLCVQQELGYVCHLAV